MDTCIFQSDGLELLMINFVSELRIPGSASFNRPRRGETPPAPVLALFSLMLARNNPSDVGILNRSVERLTHLVEVRSDYNVTKVQASLCQKK